MILFELHYDDDGANHTACKEEECYEIKIFMNER